ncbi:MAG: PAS domain S-box protein [SAR324 cluster bacterium]|nr:PAS domain S-box protein [SAR324 cluster bacterium]
MKIQFAIEDLLKFLQATLNALSSNIAILDHQGKIIAVNKAWNQFAEWNGYAGENYGLGANYLQICQGAEGENAEEASEVETAILQVMRKKADTMEVKYPCHSPTEQRWFTVKISSFELNGEIWTVIAHDNITERELAEQQLQASQAELQELNTNKDKLFSIISHDLKSPFHSLMGFAEIFSNDLKDYSLEDLQEFGTHIYAATNNLYGLLDNLLQWSQIQTGKMDYNPVTLDASTAITNVTGLLQGNAFQKKIELVTRLEPQSWIVADTVMIQLIFQNLIANSIKFTEPGGSVTVKSNINSNSVELNVNDNGIGIPPRQLSNLFKVGKQVSTLGTAQEKGTGLGLILCKELIEKNRGHIQAQSTPGQGTQIQVQFPLAAPPQTV